MMTLVTTCKQNRTLAGRAFLLPILFNIMVDMLSILKKDDQIIGVIPKLVDDESSILQYANDTIILMDHDFEAS
jgi:hypothetical protein